MSDHIVTQYGYKPYLPCLPTTHGAEQGNVTSAKKILMGILMKFGLPGNKVKDKIWRKNKKD